MGETSDSYYDMWYYQDDNEYELHIYWDEGNPYIVELIPVEGENEYGDPIFGYEEEVNKFDNLEDAQNYAWYLMRNY
jgi:hypothetical protein